MRIARPAAAGTAALLGAVTAALAAPVTYFIDYPHTVRDSYSLLVSDHFGYRNTLGWKTSGTLVYDRDESTGQLEVTMATRDESHPDQGPVRGHVDAPPGDALDEDLTRYPTAEYKGTLARFIKGVPTEVHGTLTLHGVTKPLVLHIGSFLCKNSPLLKKEVCHVDAAATLDRSDYGMHYFPFFNSIRLAISVEAGAQ